MGLTSSQGRLLMLTSRLNDISLDETLLSQRHQQLAWHSEKIAKEYSEKTSNQKMVMKVYDKNEEKGYRKTDLNYSDMTSMGYLVTDASNRIYLTKQNGEWVVPTASALSDSKIFDGNVTTDESGKSTISLKGKSYEVVDGTELVSDKKKLQNNIINGTLFVMNTYNQGTGIVTVNQLASDNNMEWVQDTSDDAEAESKYQYETARIASQQKLLDTEIKQLETQHNAVVKEIESVDKVIDKNIERTFKIFENG